MTTTTATPRVVVLRAGWHEPTWREQSARERLRWLSRRALESAAREVGAPAGPFEKDEHGAPLPFGVWRWSVSHSGGFGVAAVGAVQRLGVDVEAATRVPSEHARQRLAELGVRAETDGEWLAAWCRVEAALKSCGCGLSALGTVTVEEALVHVGKQAVMTRIFARDGAVVAVAGGGVCAMQEPRFLVAPEDAA